MWGCRGIAPPFLTSVLDGGEWSASRSGRFIPGEGASGTHWMGGWVGPRAGLDRVKKSKISFSCRELNPGRPGRSPPLYRLSSYNKRLDRWRFMYPIYVLLLRLEYFSQDGLVAKTKDMTRVQSSTLEIPFDVNTTSAWMICIIQIMDTSVSHCETETASANI
jgi:hypothetical protein